MHFRNRNLPAIVAAIIISCITVSGQTLSTLHSFGGTDGRSPEAVLIEASDGNFYGTTALGGDHGQGTVFKIDPAGNVTTLHSFNGFPSDGAGPIAGLVQGNDGNFYGTTASGGAFFQGTVFRMTPSGAITVLHSFNGFLSEGAVPIAGLVQGSSGNLYGTTALGGEHFKGTIFKIDPAGSLTTLHSFSGSPGEGALPFAALVQASDGNFYGTTALGGAHFMGTVFQIDSAGSLTTLLSFSGFPTEGANPVAAVVQGNDGDFYGTTALGGMHFKGTVFKVDVAGNLTTLHSFGGPPGEGALPFAGLMLASDGDFYGPTATGGAHFRGTLFKIDVTGTLTTLHSFSGSPSEGALPFAGLLQDSSGNFYGTTSLGGEHGEGTVFTLH